jgi:hypothetical protein
MNVNIDGKNINAALKNRNLQNHLGLPHLCTAPQIATGRTKVNLPKY